MGVPSNRALRVARYGPLPENAGRRISICGNYYCSEGRVIPAASIARPTERRSEPSAVSAIITNCAKEVGHRDGGIARQDSTRPLVDFLARGPGAGRFPPERPGQRGEHKRRNTGLADVSETHRPVAASSRNATRWVLTEGVSILTIVHIDSAPILKQNRWELDTEER